LKKRFPSKCIGNIGPPAPCFTNSYLLTVSERAHSSKFSSTQRRKERRDKRRENQGMSPLRLPPRSLRLCVEHTPPCSNLTHVPASDKCRSLHKEQRWLTSKSPGVPRRPLPLGARPRNNRQNQPQKLPNPHLRSLPPRLRNRPPS
jgi:hypothetical protein